jgi:hypothetical protein
MFTKLSFFKNSGLGTLTLLLLFSLKVFVGFLYSRYFAAPSQIANADTWTYFIDSKLETNWLLQNPKEFFADFFTNQYNVTGSFFTGTNSFWNDLKATSFTKFLAVLNLFSNKNYYINLLFFNVIFMFGNVAFYKLISENFTIKKWVLVAAIFLTPSFLFWCSGIHKDGLVFSATAVILYIFNKMLVNGFSYQRAIILIICFSIIFLLRNYYLLAIFPALIGWFIAQKLNKNATIVFALMVTTCLVLFIFSTSFDFTKGIMGSVVSKHNEFALLEGNTKFQTPFLETNATSVIQYFPFAMQTALFRPFPSKKATLQTLFITIENYILIITMLFCLFLFFKTKNEIFNSPIISVCLTISFFILLFIGYTVCFDGAIVRYRSVSSPFLIVPCVLIILGQRKIIYQPLQERIKSCTNSKT